MKRFKSLFENCKGCCGWGFWLWPRRRGRSIPAAGYDGGANAGHRQKTRRSAPCSFQTGFKLALFISAAIACVWASGCSKKNNGEMSPTSGGGSATGSSAAPSESGGPVTLKLNWQVGKVYEQEVAMHQTSSIQVPGVPQPMEQTMTMNQGFSVSVLRSTPDGGKELELKFLSQKLNSRMGTNAVFLDFDSSKPASEDGNNPAAPVFRKMLDADVKFQLDAHGKIVKVEGLDEFFATSTVADRNSLAIAKGMLNEDTLKQMVSRDQGFPDKPVKVGDSWPVNLDMKAGPMGSLQMKMIYTFKGWDQYNGNKCVLLTFTGTVTSKPKANPNGVSVSIESGDLSGKSWFDPAIGMVVESSMDQNMNVKFTAQGKIMTSQMKQNVTTKVVKISDLK